MAALSKSRHELFAQSVANGKTLDEAYSDAGYLRRRGNPSRLRKLTSIDIRIAELLEERAAKVTNKYAAEVEHTRDRILGELEEARLMAIKEKIPGAAWQAALAKARVLGFIIDRREVGDAGAFDALTDEELVAKAALKARELGVAGPQLVEDDEDKVA